MWRHLPNIVTATRGLLGPVIGAVILSGDRSPLAFALFIAAISTDLVDGWIARRLEATSELGVLLDPVADKVLTDTVWAALWAGGWAPGWLAGPMLARDAVVVCLWLVERSRGRVWNPNLAGRLMVTFEGIALPVLLLRSEWLGVHWPSVGVALGTLSLALAVLSSVGYVRDRLQALRASRDAI